MIRKTAKLPHIQWFLMKKILRDVLNKGKTFFYFFLKKENRLSPQLSVNRMAKLIALTV